MARALRPARSFACVIAVFGIALVVASGIGVDSRGARARDHRERSRIAAASSRAGRRFRCGPIVIANERGWLALLPPAPLSALAIGQGDVYPNYIKVTARSLDALVSGDQIEHPLAVASGQFDAAFVVLFLYPLLIFAVSFDLTATERDRGTLRMVLAQPVTLGEVVAGKMIVRAFKLAVPVLLIPIGMAALFSPTERRLLAARDAVDGGDRGLRRDLARHRAGRQRARLQRAGQRAGSSPASGCCLPSSDRRASTC